MTPSPKSSAPVWRADLIAAALTVVWLLFVRAALDCPWGFSPTSEGGTLKLGIPFNIGDTWSYLSWVTQYREGHLSAGLIYTTEPHPALLWIFPLWLIGKVAALTGLSTLGVYFASGVVGAAAAVVLFRRAARAIGLDASACDWATVVLVLGSGASWLWHLLHRLHLASEMNGGEFGYLDFFPSTAFMVYPYHALSYGLLAALWWSVAVGESRLAERRDARGPLVCAALLAALLSVSRPYEPIAFAGAYSLKMLWAYRLRKREPEAWRAVRIVFVLLGLGLAPGVAWNAYVAMQPVWSTFAHRSLALGLDRIGWLSAFGGLWLLGALGLRPALAAPNLRGVLPIAASLLGAFVLLGFNHAQAKLASGLIVGVALLGGWGGAQLVRGMRARWPAPAVVVGGASILTVLLGLPSLALVLLAIHLSPQATAEPEFYALARQIPLQSSAHRTLVLTDATTGAMLPGLWGLRVYAGHFSLTNDFERKEAELRQAGLDPTALPEDAAASAKNLRRLLAALPADAALIDVRCRAALATLADLGWQNVETNARWKWLKPPQPVP